MEIIQQYSVKVNGDKKLLTKLRGVLNNVEKETDIEELINRVYNWKPRPIIFLDVDGVLNNEEFFKKRLERKHTDSWSERYLCPILVEKLNKITDLTNARIVFSSSHRRNWDTEEEMAENLKNGGIKADIIGRTPKLFFENGTHSVPRGCEIKAWIERNIGDKVSEFKYVILDDDSDMLYWQRKNFVQTDGQLGLTDEGVHKAIKILNGE